MVVMALKRKAEYELIGTMGQSDPKKLKTNRRKVKSNREQERVLLENFVKYGILPTSVDHKGNQECIQISLPTPLSPLKTPARTGCTMYKHEDQMVPEASPSSRTNSNQVRFWRPWLIEPTAAEKAGKICNKRSLKQIPKPLREWRRNVCQKQNASPRPSNMEQQKLKYRTNGKIGNSPPQMMFPIPACDASFTRPSTNNMAAIKKNRRSTTPAAQWNTASPEFLNSFKQPPKMMYPSQAVGFKYQGAQEMMKTFPVQVSMGYYDDTMQQNRWKMEAMKHNPQNYLPPMAVLN